MEELLRKQWIHSHEEDTEEEKVFRPADYKLPPSRGRKSFELKSDGTLIYTGLSTVDKHESTTGKWELKNNNLILHPASQSKTSETLQIISVKKIAWL